MIYSYGFAYSDEKWEDIDPLEMVTLKPQKWDKRSSDNEKILLYNNQNITFHCVTNLVYFALGSRITISFQNGTRVLFDGIRRFSIRKTNQVLYLLCLNYKYNVMFCRCQEYEQFNRSKNLDN